MLVSAMGQMMAIQRRYRAEQSMMDNFSLMNSMMGRIGNGAYSGADMRSLHQMDMQMQLNMVKNRLDLQVAELQEEYFAKKIAEETQRNKRLNTIA